MPHPHILHIFSRYSAVGGEEICFKSITEELRNIAEVTNFVYSTEELLQSPHNALIKIRYMLHNKDIEERLYEHLHQNKYDAWIIHNTFPAMSPCVYKIALEQSIPIIHYLHNYRIKCINGVFYRNEKPCFSCQGNNCLAGIMHSCWRGNPLYSALAAVSLHKTRHLGTWEKLSAYIAVSNRQRELLIQSGVPKNKIRTIPHFLRQQTQLTPQTPRRDVLYTGRLTQEKGVFQLIQAWERISPPNRTLYLMGDGPLRAKLENYVSAHNLKSIRLLGFIPKEKQGEIRSLCGLSIAPSLWEETFGMVVLESWLHSTPIIVTPCGGLPELITQRQNGWITKSTSVNSLEETLRTALQEEVRWPIMGTNGQKLLNTNYSPETWRQAMSSLFKELCISHTTIAS